MEIHVGDCLDVLSSLPAGSVNTCVTSPPYWGLRDYGVNGQLGMEETPEQYVTKMVEVFREVRRVLRGDGTLWLNLGDSYSVTSYLKQSGGVGAREQKKYQRGGAATKCPPGFRPKNLMGIPWRVAFALQADGWNLRQDIIWQKPNPMPESVRDRCTKAHEYIFLLSKSGRYYFDSNAIKEPAVCPRGPGNTKPRIIPGSLELRLGMGLQNIGPRETRNKRSVWTVSTKGFKGAHFATFPPDLVEPCILAGAPVGGTVLDPFFGAGTTGLVSKKHGRHCIGIELNKDYADMARARIEAASAAKEGCHAVRG